MYCGKWPGERGSVMYISSTMLKSTHDITYFNSHFKYILFAHELTFVVSYGVKILLYYANSKSAKNVNTFLRSTAREHQLPMN